MFELTLPIRYTKRFRLLRIQKSEKSLHYCGLLKGCSFERTHLRNKSMSKLFRLFSVSCENKEINIDIDVVFI